MSEADLRRVVIDGTTYVAAEEFAAVLLDVALDCERAAHPPTAVAVLRGIADGLARIPDQETP